MSLEKLVSRRGGEHQIIDDLRRIRAEHGVVAAEQERDAARRAGLPLAAVHGTASYYADFQGPQGERHVRVCEGTACFVAGGGGRHLSKITRVLGVRPGDRAADGSVSVQSVRCLGYCYAAPAALDGDVACAGVDLTDQLTGARAPTMPEIPATAVTRPVLLDRTDEWQVWQQVLAHGGGARVLQEVSASGLRGRGGAGFPAARKWETVAAMTAGPRFVVANGDEGDPGSYSDRLLMERHPAKVLEGLALAGLACRAEQGFIYVRSEYPAAFESLRRALAHARALGHLGRGVFDVEVVQGAGSYVAGEETGLLRSLAGLRATVRARPPYPTTSGYLGRPTAVNNVETLASVPAIVAEGGAEYARLGRSPETGTMLVCLNERFARPGAYEVEPGTRIRDIVADVGGGLRDGLRLTALQVGGPLGGFLAPDQLDLPLLDSALGEAGVALGHGGLVAIDDTISPAQLTQHLWDFAAKESCGICTPCREGTGIGARDPAAAAAYLDAMDRASLCAFGRSVPRAVRSLQRALGVT